MLVDKVGCSAFFCPYIFCYFLSIRSAANSAASKSYAFNRTAIFIEPR
jgi:hypothetical protein